MLRLYLRFLVLNLELSILNSAFPKLDIIFLVLKSRLA